MVATADLGFEPKLDSIKHIGGVHVIYEPEQFLLERLTEGQNFHPLSYHSFILSPF
ncbi:hypothetical protein ES702_07212 [subsurface metagenome]